jgi:filamentous hemagglutinin family protein
MKKDYSFLLSLACLLAASEVSKANPAGGVVASGSATILPPGGGMLTINQQSSKAIINWNSFSIASGEKTQFIQPGQNAAILNRVTGGNPTQIYGTLQGNGQIYLINPSGILVGPGGVVNTHSFIGSTLDVSDSSFLSGAGMVFSGDSAAGVRNEGTINAIGGDVFLFAHTVDNIGTINAPGGTAGLAAGSEILLQPAGDERIAVLAGNVNVPQSATGVNNLGAVNAASAELKAAGGNIYALAINNGGIVRATSVVNQGGRILLRADGGNVQSSGTLDASSTTGNGGTVQVLGNSVTLASGSLVDASGATGGGTINIGGGFRGSGTSAPNATQTTVEQGAVIRADSTTSGDGGNVSVWSDDGTVFNGTIYARALGLTGNGGYAEASGKLDLTLNGFAHLESANGKFGTFLADPGSVDIISEPFGFFTGPNTFSDGYVRFELGFADFPISAVGGVLTVDPGASIYWSAATSLNLRGDLGVGLSTGSLISGPAGNLTVTSGITISLDGSVLAGTMNLTSGAQITDDGIGSTTVTGGTMLAAGVGKSITLTGANSFSGAVSTTSAANLTLNDLGVIHLGPTVITGSLNVTATQGIVQTGTLSVSGLGSTFTASGPGVNLDLSTSPNTFVNGVTLATIGGGSFNSVGIHDSDLAPNITGLPASGLQNLTLIYDNAGYNAGYALPVAGEHFTGNLTIEVKKGAITDSGNLIVDGKTTLSTDTGSSITLGTALKPDSFGMDVRVIAAKDVNLVTGGGIILGGALGSTISGALNVTAGGPITETGALNVTGGPSTFTASAPLSIDLSTAANMFGGGVVLTPSANFTSVGIRDDLATTPTDITGLPTTGLQNLTLIYKNAGYNAGYALPAAGEHFTGNLTITVNAGAISDSGKVIVDGKTKLTTDNGSGITMGTALNPDSLGNGAANDVTVSGKDVTLVVSGPVSLGASTTSGDLNVTAGGTISQTGLLKVGGNGNFTVTAAGSDLSLASFDNSFGGGTGVTLAATSPGTFNNVYLWDGSGTPHLNGLPSSVHDLTLIYDSQGIALPGETVTGALNVTANGAITQTGALTVTGASIFTQTAQNSTLDLSANSGNANVFTGGVTLATGLNLLNATLGSYTSAKLEDATSATTPTLAIGSTAVIKDLTLLYDNNGIVLPGVTLTGGLNVTAKGPISQSGQLNVTGASTFTETAAGSTLSLTGFANVFTGGVTLANSGSGTYASASLEDATFPIPTPPTLTLSGATIANLTLQYDNAGIVLPSGTITGNLQVTATGAISDNGNLTVDGTTSLGAGLAPFVFTQNITLGTGANPDSFGQAVTINYGDIVSLVASGPVILGGAVGIGGLNVTAAGNITQTGQLFVLGPSVFTETAMLGNFDLSTFQNVFQGGVYLTTTGSGSYNNVALQDQYSFPSLTLPTTINNNLTLEYDLAGIILPAVTVKGALMVTAASTISDIGGLTVDGQTILSAGSGNNITLGTSLNRDSLGDGALNDVSVTTGNNVTLWVNGPVSLGASTVSGLLSVNSTGAINETGALNVTSGSSFTITTANSTLGLGGFANFFGGTGVNLSLFGNGNNLAIWDENPTPAISGFPTSFNNLSLRYEHSLFLGSGRTITGNLSITSKGSISDTGNNTVAGTTTLNATGTGNDITLGTAGLPDSFGGDVIITSGNNVTINAKNAFGLGGAAGMSTVGGALNVTSTGSISQDGVVNVTGAESLTASGPISFGYSGGASTVGGILNINANGVGTGNITQAGVVNVTGDENLVAGGTIALGASGGVSTVGGNMNVTSDGAISENGALSVQKNASFYAQFFLTPGFDVNLNNAQNSFSTIQAYGNNVTIKASGGYTAQDIEANGAANLGAGGNVSLGYVYVNNALNLNVGGSVNEIEAAGNGIITGSLAGSVGGSLQLGSSVSPFNLQQPTAAQEIDGNRFQSIGNLTTGGTLYIYNSGTGSYTPANPDPNPTPKGSDVLGLIIAGNVVSGSDSVIRTQGDLELMGSVEAKSGNIQLAAETGGNFHNLNGASVSGGKWVAGSQTASSTDVKADNGRFLIYSTDRTLNFNNYINGQGQQTFNGLTAGFLAQFASISSHANPIIRQDGTTDDGKENGFVFGQEQNFVQPNEVAKFYLNVEHLETSSEIDETTGAEYLPPERPPTIWTSSYHVQLQEEQDKKKKKNKPAGKSKPVAFQNAPAEIKLAGD